MKTITAALLFVLALLAGCSPEAPPQTRQEGITHEEAQADPNLGLYEYDVIEDLLDGGQAVSGYDAGNPGAETLANDYATGCLDDAGVAVVSLDEVYVDQTTGDLTRVELWSAPANPPQ